MLHFRESMGLRGPEHLYLMKEHFDQSINETNIWNTWNLGAVILIGLIVLLQAPRPYLLWVNVVYCGWLLGLLTTSRMESKRFMPHSHTESPFPDDTKICGIMNDEIQHSKNLLRQ